MTKELESHVQEHAMRIQAMEVQSIQQMEKMDKVITEIGGMTSTLREYIVRHDNLKESNDRMWSTIEATTQEMSRLWKSHHSNQNTIDSVNPMGERLQRQIAENKTQSQKQHDRVLSDISKLQSVDAANQPIIDGVRAMNAKLVWLVVAAMLSPLTLGVAMFFKQ